MRAIRRVSWSFCDNAIYFVDDLCRRTIAVLARATRSGAPPRIVPAPRCAKPPPSVPPTTCGGRSRAVDRPEGAGAVAHHRHRQAGRALRLRSRRARAAIRSGRPRQQCRPARRLPLCRRRRAHRRRVGPGRPDHRVFRFDAAARRLDPMQLAAIPSGFAEIYGICLYRTAPAPITSSPPARSAT